jgi:hypothetical protein
MRCTTAWAPIADQKAGSSLSPGEEITAVGNPFPAAVIFGVQLAGAINSSVALVMASVAVAITFSASGAQ